jgi:Predicted esterase
MKRTLSIFAALVVLGCSLAPAFETRKLEVPSASMKRNVAATVIVPEGLRSSKKPVPVVYLLHGFADNDTAWPTRTTIGDLADQYNVLVVCPDADNSWYFDAPADPSMRFETFVSSELVDFIDKRYPTIRSRKARATAGLSMGGHGALFLAIRHPEVFGAAVSMSGGVDIRHSPNKWEIAKALGPIEEHPDRWDELAVVTQAKALKDGQIAISIDCGVDDFFIDINRALHAQLLEQKVGHDYTERPGAHDWDYWRRSIVHQMLWLSEFFGKSTGNAN